MAWLLSASHTVAALAVTARRIGPARAMELDLVLLRRHESAREDGAVGGSIAITLRVPRAETVENWGLPEAGT